MKWSFRVLRVAGIEVRIHLTFLLLLGWMAWAFYREGGAEVALRGLGFVSLLFLCVLLHEFGHALAARTFGIRTPDITLLPIGGLARLERMPEKPTQELVVALAGPAVNVVIAATLFAILGQVQRPESLDELILPQVALMQRMAHINLILVGFNLIPAFPMDGGRVLRALLAIRLDYVTATGVAAQVGQVLAVVLGVLGFFPNPWLHNPFLVFIAIFVYLGAGQEAEHVRLTAVMRKGRARDAMMTEVALLREEHVLNDAVERLLATPQKEFPVVDGEGRVVGLLRRGGLLEGLRDRGAWSPVAEAMSRDVLAVPADEDLDRVSERMAQAGADAAVVLDPEGRLEGLVTLDNLEEWMDVRSALRARPGPPPLPSAYNSSVNR